QRHGVVTVSEEGGSGADNSRASPRSDVPLRYAGIYLFRRGGQLHLSYNRHVSHCDLNGFLRRHFPLRILATFSS
ncbi:hypothetical protein PENTCL1PPCAC_20613, partial [Pristionchus entomophagus]